MAPDPFRPRKPRQLNFRYISADRTGLPGSAGGNIDFDHVAEEPQHSPHLADEVDIEDDPLWGT